MAIPSAYEYLKHLMAERGQSLIDATVLAVNGALVDVRVAGSARVLRGIPLAEHVYTERLVPGAMVSLGLHQTQPFVAAIHLTGEFTSYQTQRANIPRPSLRIEAEADGYRLDWRIPHAYAYRYEVFGNTDDSGENPVLLEFTYYGITTYKYLFDTLTWFAVRAVQRDGQRGPLSAWVTVEANTSGVLPPLDFKTDSIAAFRKFYISHNVDQPDTYEIERADDDQGTNAEHYWQGAATWPLPNPQVLAIPAEQGDPLWYRCRAGKQGAWSTWTGWIEDNVPLPVCSALGHAYFAEGHLISWSYRDQSTFPSTYFGNDVKEVNIWRATTGINPVDAELVYTVGGAETEWFVEYSTDVYGYYIGVSYIDYADNENQIFWTGPWNASPYTPASLSVAAMPGGFEVNWTPPDTEPEKVAYYQVEWASDDQGSDAELCFTGDVLGKFDAADGLHTWFRVRAVGFDGSYSDWTAWTQYGTPPAQVTGLSARSASTGGWLMVDLAVDQSHDDMSFRRWRVYVADDDQGANAALWGYMLTEEASGKWVDQEIDTTKYYALKGEDWAGNLSTSYSAWVSISSRPEHYGLVDDRFEEYGNDALGFDGLGYMILSDMDDRADFTSYSNVANSTFTYCEGAGSLEFNPDVTGGNPAYVEKTVSWDLTADGRFDSDADAFSMWVMSYTSSGEPVVKLTFYTDASNYYSFSVTADGSVYEQTLYFKKSSFVATGSPSWANITRWRLEVLTTNLVEADKVYIDDVRLVRGVHVGENNLTEADDTFGVWSGFTQYENNPAAGGAIFEWHVYPGMSRGKEPPVPYSLGHSLMKHGEIISVQSLDMYTHTRSQIQRGVAAAGIWFTDTPDAEEASQVARGSAGLGIFCDFPWQETGPGTGVYERKWNLYVVELSYYAHKLRLLKFVDGVRTVLAEVSYTVSPQTLYWVGIDFRDPDGLLKVYLTDKNEAVLFNGENLKITKTDTSVARDGPVAVHATSNTRFVAVRAGSPAHAMSAEYAYVARTTKALQGRAMAATAPTSGQAVVWNSTTGRWEPGSVTPGAHTHVEADITNLDHDAVKLRGRTIAYTVPTTKDVLCWDGVDWGPGRTKGVRVYLNGDRTHTNATAIPFNAEERDDAGFHNNVTNNTRLVIPSGYAGWYAITGRVNMASWTTGNIYFQAYIVKNGTDTLTANMAYRGNNYGVNVIASTLAFLSDGDYVELFCNVGSGSSFTVGRAASGGYETHFEMVRIGPLQ